MVVTLPLLGALGISHNPQFHQALQLYPSTQTRTTDQYHGMPSSTLFSVFCMSMNVQL